MIDPRLVVDAALALLRAAWPDVGAGHRVGDHEAPADTTYPYAILYMIPGGAPAGTMGDPVDMGTVTIQVSSTGGVETPGETGARKQAQLLSSKLRTALLRRNADGSYTNALSGPGWTVAFREQTAYGGLDKEGRVATAVDLFALTVVPA